MLLVEIYNNGAEQKPLLATAALECAVTQQEAFVFTPELSTVSPFLPTARETPHSDLRVFRRPGYSNRLSNFISKKKLSGNIYSKGILFIVTHDAQSDHRELQRWDLILNIIHTGLSQTIRIL